MDTPRLIGLSGYAQSGKDTLADFMTEHLGYERIAFADKLREVVRAIDPIVGFVCPVVDGHEVPVPRPLRVSDLWDEIGYEAMKAEYPEFREIIQRVGTEAGRKIIDYDLWVNLTMEVIRAHPNVPYVVTDVRFPNEADAIRSEGGVILRISRPGRGPVNGHASETALDDYDFDAVIKNDSTLSDFYEEACVTLRGL